MQVTGLLFFAPFSVVLGLAFLLYVGLRLLNFSPDCPWAMPRVSCEAPFQ